MWTNTQLMKAQCPLIEEFHITSICGAKERKQWILGGRITTNIQGWYKVTISSLSGGVITSFDHYQVMAQRLDSMGEPTYKTIVDWKTATQFEVRGNPSHEYSVLVLGTEDAPHRATKRWAKDYCPYCKSQGFDAILGSTVKDQVCFSFKHTQVAGTDAVTFASDATPYKILGLPKGSLKSPLVKQMEDDDYQILITKSTFADAAVTIPAYASSLTEVGFNLTGDIAQKYDIMILGKVRY